MSSSMWNSEKFEKSEIVSAKNIVEEQCKELSKITGGEVIGILKTYDGKYKSEGYTIGTFRIQDEAPLYSTLSCNEQLRKKSIETFNVQEVLGNRGKFVYEFYLTSKATPHYKFRVFLLYFDAKLYPVGLSIEQSIADEINCKTEIELPDKEAFKSRLASILDSDTVTNVIKNLLSF